MKKIHLYLAFIFCTIVPFTGCYPTGDKRINENEISNYVSNANEPNYSIPSKEITSFSETSGKIDLELKNVKVSLELPDYAENSVNQISAEMREWNEEKLKSIFFNSEQALSYSEYENRYANIKCHSYETEDGRFLSYEPGFIAYYNSQKRRDYSYPMISSSVFSVDIIG